MMTEESPGEEEIPSKYLENYTSWYRFLSQDQGMAFQLMSDLKDILPGFDFFKFEPVGEKHRLLKIYFKTEKSAPSIGYNFNELSDGQRMLIALYTLLAAARSDRMFKYTLCLDEPENFLALPEIQPWLTELFDRCSQEEMQCLLISHHPEFINYLLASPIGRLFERQSNQPTRIKSIGSSKKEENVPMSEVVARGWLDA
jgi:predicted ATPase